MQPFLAVLKQAGVFSWANLKHPEAAPLFDRLEILIRHNQEELAIALVNSGMPVSKIDVHEACRCSLNTLLTVMVNKGCHYPNYHSLFDYAHKHNVIELAEALIASGKIDMSAVRNKLIFAYSLGKSNWASLLGKTWDDGTVAIVLEELQKAASLKDKEKIQAICNTAVRDNLTYLMLADALGHKELVEKLIALQQDGSIIVNGIEVPINQKLFKTFFGAFDIETDEPVSIPYDGDVAIFKSLVRFMYTYSLDQMDHQLFKQYALLADQYGIKGIHQLLQYWLAQHLERKEWETKYLSRLEGLPKLDEIKGPPEAKFFEEKAKALADGDQIAILEALEKGRPIDNKLVFDACRAGWTTVIKYMLKQGFNLNIQDHLGTTPLMQACQYLHPDIVTLLLSAGANPTTSCRQGFNALLFLLGGLDGEFSDLNLIEEVLKKLFAVIPLQARRALANSKIVGQSALETACRFHKEEVALYLIEQEAGNDLKALGHAVERNFIRVIKKSIGLSLIKEFLARACIRTQAEMARLLVQAGANPFIPYGDASETPFQLAAERGLLEVIRAILDKIALLPIDEQLEKFSQQNESTRDVLNMAKDHSYDDVDEPLKHKENEPYHKFQETTALLTEAIRAILPHAKDRVLALSMAMRHDLEIEVSEILRRTPPTERMSLLTDVEKREKKKHIKKALAKITDPEIKAWIGKEVIPEKK